MTKITKWLYLSSIFFVLFTLVKEFPPYRIYLLDLVLGMCLCFLSIQWLVNPTGSIFKWQGIDSLLMALLVSLTIAFTLLQARVERQELLAEDRTRVRVKKLASVY